VSIYLQDFLHFQADSEYFNDSRIYFWNYDVVKCSFYVSHIVISLFHEMAKK
jgi:hypothetical protein